MIIKTRLSAITLLMTAAVMLLTAGCGGGGGSSSSSTPVGTTIAVTLVWPTTQVAQSVVVSFTSDQGIVSAPETIVAPVGGGDTVVTFPNIANDPGQSSSGTMTVQSYSNSTGSGTYLASAIFNLSANVNGSSVVNIALTGTTTQITLRPTTETTTTDGVTTEATTVTATAYVNTTTILLVPDANWSFAVAQSGVYTYTTAGAIATLTPTGTAGTAVVTATESASGVSSPGLNLTISTATAQALKKK